LMKTVLSAISATHIGHQNFKPISGGQLDSVE
jgi:hypothetical protein